MRSELLNAIINNDLASVIELLDKCIDVDQKDHNGWSGLHFAAQNNNPEIGQILIKRGAKLDEQDSHGNTPLWRATFSAREDGSL